MKTLLFNLVTALALSLGFTAKANITGFGGDGTGWTRNSTDTPPTFVGDVLTPTFTGVQNNATSAWFNTGQNATGSWAAMFTYIKTANDSEGAPQYADGFTFAIQKTGLNALGNTGGGLGYGSILNSVAVAVKTTDFSDFRDQSIIVETNGSQTGGGGIGSLDFVTLNSAITFTVNYNAATQLLTVDASQAENTFHSETTINLSTVLGSGPYYVGFTGATGGISQTTQISAFTFTEELTATDDTATVTAGQPVTVQVSANDFYTGETISFTFDPGTMTGAVLVNNGNNTATLFWTPPVNFSGDYTATYTASNGTITSNTATVRITVNPVPAPAGNYAVIITDPMFGGTLETTGFLRGTLTTQGAFTGKIFWQSFAYAVNGVFDGEGNLTLQIPGTHPARTLTLTMTKFGVNGGIDGTLTDGMTSARFQSEAPAGQVATGRITGLISNRSRLALANEPRGKGLVLGTGWFAGEVKSNGKVKLRGRMPDGRSFTGTSFLNDQGEFEAYNAFPRYDGRGAYFGVIRLSPQGVSNSGIFLIRPPSQTPRYTDGYETKLSVSTGYFIPAAAGQPSVNFGNISPNLTLSFFNGNIPNGTRSFAANLAGADVFTFPSGNPLQLALTVNRATGMFKGTFIHPTAGKRNVSGVFLQDRLIGQPGLQGADPRAVLIPTGTAGGVFKGGLQAGGLQFTSQALTLQ